MHGAEWCVAVVGGRQWEHHSEARMRRDKGEGEPQTEVFEPEQDGGGSCQTVCCLCVVIPSHNGSVYVRVGLIHRFNINDPHLFTGTVPANRGCETGTYMC